MFHPKHIQTPGQERYIEGIVNGAAVSGMGLVENPGPAQKGKLNLELNQNTYMSLEFELGYAHRFNLISTSKFGNITYVPGISGGLHAGKTYSSTVDSKGDRQEYKERFSVQGGGGSIRNKIEWLSPREKIGIFYENKVALYHREHDLLDGSQKYNLAYSSNSFGVSVMINNPNRHNISQQASL
jgi:hypothetical protein